MFPIYILTPLNDTPCSACNLYLINIKNSLYWERWRRQFSLLCHLVINSFSNENYIFFIYSKISTSFPSNLLLLLWSLFVEKWKVIAVLLVFVPWATVTCLYWAKKTCGTYWKNIQQRVWDWKQLQSKGWRSTKKHH